MTRIFRTLYWTWRKWEPWREGLRCLRGAWRYATNKQLFLAQMPVGSAKLRSRPRFGDATDETRVDLHYLYQAMWAHQTLQRLNPPSQVDVGSDFRWISLEQVERKIIFVDIRSPGWKLPNLKYVRASITDLPFADRSLPFLSCLHVIEHIGLGRYGDPIDFHGSHKATRELVRVMCPGAFLLLSTPVGKPAIYYDAHRVWDPKQVLLLFDVLQLEEFSLVTDEGQFRPGVTPEMARNQLYACGLFLFRKAP